MSAHPARDAAGRTAPSLPEGLLALLDGWMPRQRWYPAKGAGAAALDVLAVVPVPAAVPGRTAARPGAGVEVLVVVLAVRTEDDVAVVQVPLALRPADAPGDDASRVGVLPDGRAVHDGPGDADAVAALLALVAGGGTAAGEGGRADGRLAPGAAVDAAATSRVLGGEQSNTSVVVGLGTDAPSILKVFRVLSPGENPDVVVATALWVAGCEQVARPLGWVSGSWADADGTPATGHLAVLSEFLTGAQDAWREAGRAVEEGESFADGARSLGRATAEVHRALAGSFGRTPVTAEGRTALVDGLAERVRWALRSAPALAPHRAALEEHVASLSDLPAPDRLPPLQRVHGDYHLGQVLSVPGRGWVVLDFEGEPLRPLAERVRPDVAVRDVVGMVRSLDYAGAHVVAERAGADGTTSPGDEALARRAAAWTAEATEAFLAGYAEVDDDPRTAPGTALHRALLLDKALYEVVYETRSRPHWLPVPLGAVERLLGTTPQAEGARGGAAAADAAGTTAPPATTTPAQEIPVDASTTPASPGPAAGHEPARAPVDGGALDAAAHGAYPFPHDVLGPHPHDGGVTVRVRRPLAERVELVLEGDRRVPLEHEHDGVWVGVVPGADVPDYRVETTWSGGVVDRADDPYRFWPTLGEVDLHLVAEGRHEQLWTALGARVLRFPSALGDVTGTSFSVWAPHARGVRVVGGFNHWDGRSHALRSLGSSGVWELFVPGVGDGEVYKLEIQGQDGTWRQKADPMARLAEVPPATGSVVTESTYTWGDDAWLERRAATDPHSGPMSVYEVHLGSWRQGLSYTELAEQLVGHVTALGFTHVELLPVAEHPFGGSWGYQVTSYYAPTSRFGSPDEFRHLVDALHAAGIGVILDWVPGHFPKDEFALARFDGEPLYEYPDPRKGEHPEWGTLVPDYGRPQVRNFLVANAVYWLEEFHLDGIRVDAVASMLYLDYSRAEGQWVPNRYGGREHLEAIELLQEFNAVVYRRVPGIVTIAEESTAWPGVTRPTDGGGLGFGLKWNMGWMHDTLDYVGEDPMHRVHHHHKLTFSLVYAFSEQYVLPISHDEVVHGKGSLLGKMPGDRWQQLAGVRAYLAYMWSHPGKQLLFMGQEFAQEREWAEARSLDWWLQDDPGHLGVQRLVSDLNALYREHPQLWERDFDGAGFEWLDADDGAGNTVSFVRRDAAGRPLVAVVNFAGLPHEDYRVALPQGGTWRQLVSTDDVAYGGSGVTNTGPVVAEDVPWHGRPASVALRVPPLGALWLVPEGLDDAAAAAGVEVDG
ncbi:1,4-alpha-glucan branching protein GlgB [Pseudokineococcus lusitanus]|uniref:1,4-alpha-glucan branching enzyme GlgB n=1 Tax=Pseudokineococcus lusitanus TaxID=763993 RepID=A0A3N1HN96_9ACTN|nr:1,4-alpha-glucan branching protein GlgB [Pseudokineococcus lusitanus]ROP43842.1 1,4-alpha-glucan branching enzyme [Pseudokineococcus lusitanus]